MVRYATPIEYSVFVLHGSQEAAQRCLMEVLKFIDPREDDLRCYQLPVRGRQYRLGRASLPEGIVWTGLPESALWS
jgi:CRISPR/Cas system-associated endoribonuclease Cas2